MIIFKTRKIKMFRLEYKKYTTYLLKITFHEKLSLSIRVVKRKKNINGRVKRSIKKEFNRVSQNLGKGDTSIPISTRPTPRLYRNK